LLFIENVILTGGSLHIALGAGAICVDNRHSKDPGLSGRGGARPEAAPRKETRRPLTFEWDAFLCVTFHGRKRLGPVFDRARLDGKRKGG
jgi:hypothetical protein